MNFVTDATKPHLGGNIQGGDPATYCPDLWNWLIPTFNIRNILDVGCGEGHSTDYFREKGCNVIGIEGLQCNAKVAKSPILVADIEAGPIVFENIDLVWCCEFVEHVANVKNVLDTICVGRILAITHADVKQSGHHHVNCQPKEYWIKLIEERGYLYDEALTTNAKRLCPVRRNHFSWHGLIFVRNKV